MILEIADIRMAPGPLSTEWRAIVGPFFATQPVVGHVQPVTRV